MATRGGIARVTGSGTFKGRYHHWDGYPAGLGKTLWTLYRERYGKDLDKMLAELIDEHPAGWSTINDADWSLPPGFTEYRRGVEKTRRPECFCHGDRHEEAWEIDEKNSSGSGCEYVYAFRVEDGKDVMVVLSSYDPDTGRKMIGMFGFGNENAVWHPIAKIDLESDELPEVLK